MARSSRRTRRSDRLARRVGVRRSLRIQVLDDRRVLAAVTGAVFEDLNDSTQREALEDGLAGRLVYLDQNHDGELNASERYALTDANGQFSIDGLGDGEYSVRVFNGTSSQFETTITQAELNHEVVEYADITHTLSPFLIDRDLPTQRTAPAVFAVGTTLQTVGHDGVVGTPLDLGAEIISLSRTSDGNLVAFSDTASGHRAWLVSDSLETVTPFVDSDLGPAITSAAVDDTGTGIVVANPSGGNAEVWSVSGQSLVATSVLVSSDSQVTSDTTPRATDGPTRSIISHVSQIDDGNGGTESALALSIWSNTNASMVSSEPIYVAGALEVVAFSDEASLLIVRGQHDLTVLDVDGNFASLYTIADTGGAVDIDAARGLVVTGSPTTALLEDSGLQLRDAETGVLVADLAIDLAAVGDVASIALDSRLGSIVVAGSSGLTQVNLRKAGSQRVTVDGEDVSPALTFGLRMIGANTAPAHLTVPSLSTLEESPLHVPAPGLLVGASDDQGDRFVALPVGEVAVGTLDINPDGSVTYVPPTDFEGVTEFTVMVTDGRDSSESVVSVQVVGTPDDPTGVSVAIAPVPENILVNQVIGVINVIDVDLVNDHEINIDNPAFQVINGNVVFVGPDKLDYESLPAAAIPLTITVIDHDTDTSQEYSASITVDDADDPVTDILPGASTVLENRPGETIASLTIVDEDHNDFHLVTTDDERFVIEFGDLKLADGVSLDREAEENGIVSVEVTAAFKDDSFTKTIVLTVLDVPEKPVGLALDNATVLEKEPGGRVGRLTIAGNPGSNGHTLTSNNDSFVFVGSTLKLAEGVELTKTPNVVTEITIEITATPDQGGESTTEAFTIAVLENDVSYHNDEYPEDVNGNGYATPEDALAIINYLNQYGPGPIGFGNPNYGYDVNADGEISALDALLVINELNSGGGSTGTVGSEQVPEEGEPEGEPVVDGDLVPAGEPIAESDPADDAGADQQVVPGPDTSTPVASSRSALTQRSRIADVSKTTKVVASESSLPEEDADAVLVEDEGADAEERSLPELTDLAFEDNDFGLLS